MATIETRERMRRNRYRKWQIRYLVAFGLTYRQARHYYGHKRRGLDLGTLNDYLAACGVAAHE